MTPNLEQWFKTTLDPNTRQAIWQYLVDHSSTDPNTGYFKIYIACRDEDDFWRRVEYRWTGEYRRYNILTKEKNKYKNIRQQLDIYDKTNQKMSLRTQQILDSRNVIDKFLLYVYRMIKKRLF
jgi:hypothetical protein